MADTQVEVEIIFDDGSVRRGFTKIAQQADNTGKKAGDNFSRGFFTPINSGINLVKTNLTSVVALAGGLAAGLGTRKIINDFISLQTAVAEVETILSDTTLSTEQLTQAFRNSSAQFGTSSADQARIFYQIVSAGITDAVAAQNTLIQANKLAIGGLTSTDQAVDILTSTLNAYRDSNISAESAADILFGTVRLGKTRIDEIASSFGQVLPTASSLGVAFEDVAGAVAALTTFGISTSEAVTQLNAVLTATLKAGPKVKKESEAIRQAFNLQALQTKGLTGFLKDLIVATGGSEETLVRLTGRAEAARAIIALAGDDFVTLSKNVDELSRSAGASDAAFQKINRTLDRQFLVLLQTITSEIQTGLTPALNVLAQSLFQFNLFLSEVGGLAGLLERTFEKLIAVIVGVATAFSSLIAPQLLSVVIPSFTSAFIFLQRTLFPRFIDKLVEITENIVTLSFSFDGARKAAQRFGVALRAAASIGISLAVTEIIELQRQLGSFDKVLIALILSARQAFAELTSVVFSGLIKATNALPDFLKRAFGITGETFAVGFFQAEIEIENFQNKIADLFQKDAEPQRQSVDRVQRFADKYVAQLQRISQATEETNEEIANKQKKFSQSVELTAGAVTNVTSALTQQLVNNLAAGAGAFDNFGKTALNIIGDFAIQLGTFVIASSKAITALKAALVGFDGGLGIAAGIGLIAVGAALKSFASGPSGSGSASGVGSIAAPGVEPAPGQLTPDQSFNDDPDVQRETSLRIEVNIQGDVLDSDESGIRIVELIQNAVDTQGATVVGGVA